MCNSFANAPVVPKATDKMLFKHTLRRKSERDGEQKGGRERDGQEKEGERGIDGPGQAFCFCDALLVGQR